MASYVAVSFNSLPIVIRQAIQNQVHSDEFKSLINQPKYSFGVRTAARYHWTTYRSKMGVVESQKVAYD